MVPGSGNGHILENVLRNGYGIRRSLTGETGICKDSAFTDHTYNYWGADWGYSGVADGVVCEKKKYQTKTSVRENNKTTASNKTHP